jgi:hypothetical protein
MTPEEQNSRTSSFYSFIEHLAKMGKIEAQIKAKEETLDALENAMDVYGSIGVSFLLEHSAVRYNKLREEVLQLKLERNRLEKQALLFELNSLKDD